MTFTKSMKTLSLTCVAVVAMGFGMGNAMADQIFDFTFSGIGASGNGTLTAVDNNNGSFTAITGTGTETIGDITSALNLILNPSGTGSAISPSGRLFFDNQLFATDPLITPGGLLFSTASGNELNLYSNSPFANANDYLFYTTSNGNLDAHGPITFALTEVPEPASVALLGLGLLGFAAARRKSA